MPLKQYYIFSEKMQKISLDIAISEIYQACQNKGEKPSFFFYRAEFQVP